MPKLLILEAALLLFLLFPRPVTGEDNHYYNIGITYSPGLPGNWKYRGSVAFFGDRTRFGIGTSMEYIPVNSPYVLKSYSSTWSGYTTVEKTENSWGVWRLGTLDFYYLPYISAATTDKGVVGYGGERPRSVVYLYGSLCPWGMISDSSADYDYSASLDLNGVPAHEFGVGYSIGQILDFKLSYIHIRHEAVNNRDVRFPKYSLNQWFVGVDLYYGGWFTEKYAETGWVPEIRNALEEARREKENARPVLNSYSPKKPVLGSSLQVSGANFRPGEEKTAVLFGNTPGEITSLEGDRLAVRVPGNIEPGNVSMRIKTSKGYSHAMDIFLAPTKPPLLTVSEIEFRDDTGDKILEADEAGEVAFRITNTKGAGKAFGLKLTAARKTNKKADLSGDRTYEIGDLDGGGSREFSMPLKAGLDLPDGSVTFSLAVSEANDFAPDPFEVKIQTKKLEPPDLQLAKIEVDDRFEPDQADKLAVGNGNTIVEPGESVEITATLLNKGTGLTKDTDIEVVSASPDITFLRPAEFSAGDIAPGEWQEIPIAFSVKKGYAGQPELPLKLVLTDRRTRFNKELPLSIKLKRSYPKTALVDIKGKAAAKKRVDMPSFGDELLNIPAARKANNDAIAVVIGIQNYKSNDVPQVTYALNDAQVFKDYLQGALGYREGNILFLKDPTKADLERVFGTAENPAGQLADYVKKGKSDVFVYYTGHGAPELQTKSAYLVPSDADPDYVRLGGYPLSVLYDNLSRLQARHVNVVLDACFSGQSDTGMIISKASPLLIAPALPGSDEIDVFSSSKASEISSWYPEKRHSLFTYFFLKGLQGEADKNKDSSITAAELQDYLAETVPYMARRLHGRKQTPVFNGKEDKVYANY